MAYEQYVKERQADVHTMEMIREKGLLRTVQEVLPAVQKRADAIFISVDMDVLDQAHAPGCPAIGPEACIPRNCFRRSGI